MDCVPPSEYYSVDQTAEVRQYEHRQHPDTPEPFFRWVPPRFDTSLTPATGHLSLTGQVSELRVG